MRYSFRRARFVTRSKRHVTRVLAFSFLLSLISVPIFSEPAKAATAGTGACTQTVGSSAGVVVTTSGSDCIVKFTSTGSNTWRVPTGVSSVRTLIVGGGGGGGAWVGGGGGGGGFRDLSSVSVTAGADISLSVGAGGTPAISNSSGLYNSIVGSNGGDSVFGSHTSAGGGKGGSHDPNGGTYSASLKPNAGGSGGGGTGRGFQSSAGYVTLSTGASGNTPSTSPSQGNVGGDGHIGGVWVAGGGGGAGGVGGTATSTSGGAGGAGASSDITGSAVMYAGGGGGIVYNSATGGGAGGSGGGGAGTPNGTGVSGTANTGGGGGGGGSTGSASQGGSGGSGVVIVRYSASVLPTFGTPSPTGNGFTVQITNYDANYSWSGAATASGTVSISSTGLVAVTGVSANTSSTATITTSRSGFATVSSTVTATSLNAVTNGSCSAAVNITSGVAVFASGTTCFVAFKSTGTSYTWSPPTGVATINLLTVAGGGGGATRHAGGGGAGGLLQLQGQAINGGTLSISVGAGGAGSISSAWNGSGYPDASNGSNSVVSGGGLDTQTAVGGGRGAVDDPAGVGGSGGGGHGSNGVGALGTSGQGYAGSNGLTNNSYWLAGGGGGAGSAGTSPNGSTVTAGSGGSGLAINWITSAAATALGVGQVSGGSAYFAGGGGGGASTGTAGTGGLGGGGAGRAYITAAGVSGTANTGGGGGGTGLDTSGGGSSAGGSGGSGVVVLSYRNTYAISYAAGDGTGTAPSTPTSVGLANSFTTPANTYTREGYTFAGWNDGTNTFAEGVRYPTSGNVSADVTLTATWSLATYSVTYSSNGGSSVATGSFTSGGSIASAPTPPTRAEFTFAGWSTTNGGTTAISFPYTPGVNANITLHAIWYQNCSLAASTTSANGNSYTTQRIAAGTNCAVTIPDGVTSIEAIVVAGGGGGGFGYVGGGGGAGEVITTNAPISVTPGQMFLVTIGSGGTSGAPSGTATSAGTDSTYRSGGSGQNSSFGNFTATGGGGGGGSPSPSESVAATLPGKRGGSGGGGTASGSNAGGQAQNSNYPGWTSYATNGGAGDSSVSGGGGGGAGGAGNLPSQGRGGAHLMLWGFALGGGGGGWANAYGSEGTNAAPLVGGNARLNTSGYPYRSNGSGGYSSTGVNGTGSGGGAGAPGGSGVVIYRYLTSNQTLTYASGGGTGNAPTSPSSVTVGSTFTTPANTYTRSGYSFAGWSDGTSVYAASVTYPTSGSVGGAVTLTATWTGNKYSYNANTGSNPPSDQTYAGSTITAASGASVSAPTGYTFNGWCTTQPSVGSSCSGTRYVSGDNLAIPGTSTVTLFAIWTTNTYTVTYNYDNATGGNSTATADFTVGGTAITLPTPTKTGYTFAGWHSDSVKTVLVGNAGATYSPTSSLTLYAKWTANTYTITYDSNGGSSISIGSFTVGGTAITLPSPTKLGFTFAGWYEASNLSGSALTSPYSPTQTRTIYAKWTTDTYTVTYNTNGGNSISNGSYTTGGTAITLPTPTRTGYTFDGWYEASNLSGSALTSPYTPTQTRTIYAKWTAGSNTVTFNSNYGTPTTSTQSITSGTATSLTSNSFTRTGYTFAGWSTLTGGGGTSYTNGQSVTIYAPVTLFAQWTEVNYTVTYDKNGASGAPEKSSEVYGIDSTGALSLSTTGTMTRSGYTFDGWYTAASGGSKIGNASASYTPSTNITLYARWNAASYSITFNSTGSTSGSAPSTLTYTTAGSAVTIPGAGSLAKTGYTFSKWNTRSDGLGTDYAIGASLTTSAPVALHPIWTANSYSVTYSDQNKTSGTAPSDLTVYNISDAATIKANTGLVRTGYTFAGWTIDSDNSGDIYQSGQTYTFGASSVIFNPVWSANTYNIAYNSNGATTDTRTVKSETYTSGSAGISLPNNANADMVRTGYTFSGWATTPTGTPLSGSSATSFTTSSDVTLYAIWTKKSITYKYNRGAINAVDMTGSEVATFPGDGTTTVYFDSTLTFSSNISSTITYAGNSYKFFGWTDGNTTYQPGNSFAIDASVIDSSPPLTFRAKWIQIFNVRYALNGGTGVVDIDDQCDAVTYVCTDGQSIQLNTAPTRAGYDFAGWQDLSGTTRAAGSTMEVRSTNYLLYAQWTAVDYSITFDSIGGSTSPASQTKNIGQVVTLPSPGTRTGYDFSGWTLGGVTYGVGTTYTVGSTNAAFTALWTAKRFNVNYDWNGGVGTPTASSIFTYGNAAITLPTGSSHTKDGYIFNGWKDQNGNAIGATHSPTEDTRFVAQWIDGSYTLTYNTVGGTVAQSTVNVSRTASTSLPTPTRTNYTFDGWYEDSGNTVLYGQAAASVTPAASKTLYAKWVQDSLSGINPAHLNSLTTITTQSNNASSWTGSHSLSGTGASLTIPADALPNGTVVQVSFVEDLARPASLINANYAYYTSVVLHWQLGTGASATVPVAAAGKPLVLTLTNPDIREGAKIYKIIRGEAREVATATQDGQVTINIYEDPEIVVAASTPTAPFSVSAVGNLNAQSTVSWTAPTSSGGAEVTSYTVTSSPGNKTCTATAATSCTVSGLTNDTTYSFTVVANNAVGSSVASAASTGIIPRLRPTFTATFDSKGGSSISGTLFNNTDGIAEPTAPTRSGYEFSGWVSTDGDASTLVTFPYSPNIDSNVTLYAYWTSTGVSSGAGASSNVPTVSPIINSPAVSRAPTNSGAPLINMPAAPNPFTAPVSRFPELQNAPYPTNGLNVPAIGEIVALVSREPVQVNVVPQQTQTLIEFGNNLSVVLTSQNEAGQAVQVAPSGALTVVQGAFVNASGEGFQENSPIEAWLFSTPIRLGSGFADSKGVFENKFAIGEEIRLGKHTLVLNGLTSDGEIATLALGVQIVEQDPAVVLEEGNGKQDSWLSVQYTRLLAGFVFFFALLALAAIARRRKDS